MVAPGSHRKTARVLLIDEQHRILLFLTHFDPDVKLPPRWITPGGGIDEGESTIDAAVRELFEETGIQVSAQILGESVWETSGRWLWGDGRNFHDFTDTFFLHRINQTFELDRSNWTPDEHRDVLDYRWWSPEDFLAPQQYLIGPPGLAQFYLDHLYPKLLPQSR